MTNFFDLYQVLSEVRLPQETDTAAEWLKSFVGKTGRQVFDWCVDAHHSINTEKDNADYDDHQKNCLKVAEATAKFLMRKHLNTARDVRHKTNNPSWWEKENGGHDDFKQLLKNGAKHEDLRNHPWYKRHRDGHKEHWKAVANSLNDTITADQAELDDCPEAADFRKAWAQFHKHISKYPRSQWKDRQVRPKATDDFSHDESN
jgi:hypothetical protein